MKAIGKTERPTFVTIFLGANDIHINKDVGAIPKTFDKLYGYKSYLICRKKIKKTNNLEIICLSENKAISEIKTFLFLIYNAKNIDCLNLYHWGRKTFFLGLTYKKLNPKGKLFVKCDLDFRGLKKIKEDARTYRIFGKILGISDVMSCEAKWVQAALNEMFDNKIQYIPNGSFSEEKLAYKYNKENYILTVGRLGTVQKTTEVLIDAFDKLSRKYFDWKLILVGNMTEKLKSELDKKLEDNKGWLKNRIIITGEIIDKAQLESIYMKSKIFALPSKWEGFALVMLEALRFGCYFIGTRGIASVYDVITNYKLGSISEVNDVDGFTQLLEEAINNDELYSSDMVNYRREYVNKNFNWDDICRHLNEILSES